MAYYGCHTDITIPYEELGSIRVIDEDGEGTSIIENGRFVLPGTEELNLPFEKVDCMTYKNSLPVKIFLFWNSVDTNLES